MTAAVGFSMGGAWVSGSNDDQMKADIDRIAACGAKWMRWDWQWFAIEQKLGTYWLDRRVQIATWIRDAGLHTLGVLGYSPSFYRLSKFADTFASPPAPDRYDDYGRYVAACAAAGSSVGVHHWEPWNESNHNQFFRAPNPNGPDIQGQMLRAARPLARAADPKCRFIVGAFAPAPDKAPNEMNSVTYTKRLYEAGYRDVIDSISFHPYNGGVALAATAGKAWDMNTTMRNGILTEMRAHGDTTKRIWSTEFGYGTAGPYHAVSEADQAKLLVAQIDFLRNQPQAGPCFVFNWKEMGDPSLGFNSYGVIRRDGTPKPAYMAIRGLLT